MELIKKGTLCRIIKNTSEHDFCIDDLVRIMVSSHSKDGNARYCVRGVLMEAYKEQWLKGEEIEVCNSLVDNEGNVIKE